MRALYYPEKLYFAIQVTFFALVILSVLAISYGQAQPPREITCQMVRIHTSGRATLSNRYCNPHALWFAAWTCPSVADLRTTENGFMPDEETCVMQGHPYR